MGTGHASRRFSRQEQFFKTPSKNRLSYGGSLRSVRAGRGARPLSCREPLHLVFKCHRDVLAKRSFRQAFCFFLVTKILQQYAARFYVKIEQFSIQHDHIHLLIRTGRRSQYQHFFRVVAGQIAQRFEKEGLFKVTDTPNEGSKESTTKLRLWKHRPFTRVVKGHKGYATIRNYIQLNEQEARGKIPYRKSRLRGMSSADWKILWS